VIVDVPSGYPEDLETFGTPDTVDIVDILSVDMTPLASGAHATSCLDMSVAASMSVDFDDRMRDVIWCRNDASHARAVGLVDVSEPT